MGLNFIINSRLSHDSINRRKQKQHIIIACPRLKNNTIKRIDGLSVNMTENSIRTFLIYSFTMLYMYGWKISSNVPNICMSPIKKSIQTPERNNLYASEKLFFVITKSIIPASVVEGFFTFILPVVLMQTGADYLPGQALTIQPPGEWLLLSIEMFLWQNQHPEFGIWMQQYFPKHLLNWK